MKHFLPIALMWNAALFGYLLAIRIPEPGGVSVRMTCISNIILLSYLTWTAWRWETAAFMIGVALGALPLSRAIILRRIREQAAAGETAEIS